MVAAKAEIYRQVWNMTSASHGFYKSGLQIAKEGYQQQKDILSKGSMLHRAARCGPVMVGRTGLEKKNGRAMTYEILGVH